MKPSSRFCGSASAPSTAEWSGHIPTSPYVVIASGSCRAVRSYSVRVGRDRAVRAVHIISGTVQCVLAR